MEEILQLIEDLTALHNRALAAGVNLDPHSTAAAEVLNAALDDRWKYERAALMAAFRRPPSSVQ
jgi:hypothetical protein